MWPRCDRGENIDGGLQGEGKRLAGLLDLAILRRLRRVIADRRDGDEQVRVIGLAQDGVGHLRRTSHVDAGDSPRCRFVRRPGHHRNFRACFSGGLCDRETHLP